MKNRPDTDKLHRLWLQQIQYEFDEICQTYAVLLERPVFEISETRRELGGWCKDTRTLRISNHLVSNYPWVITQQVLKHEMAHQICSERSELVDGPQGGHGNSFQQACEILGVLPEYRGYRVLPAEFADGLNSESNISERGQKFLARVEKLLALGKSSNEYEAERAIQKANELIEKYHLSQLLSKQQAEYTFSIINRKRKQIATYQRFICMILQNFFFVQVVLSRIYDPLEDQTYKTIELFGSRENVAIAEYCYFFLENQLALSWGVNRHQFGKKQRSQKNSYLLGMVRGFNQKLEEQHHSRQRDKNETDHKALVLAENTRLQKFVAMRFPRLSKRSSGTKKVYGDTFQKGVEAGKRLTFSEGISAAGKSGPCFIN
jgi:Protein of unknown function (DUF2786)/SprT-like family